MKITRAENSISWQDENSGGSVGITGVMCAEPDEERRRAYNEWVEYCARRVVADPHTVPEAIAWMNARWDAEPLSFDHWTVKHFYASLVEQFCADTLTHVPGEFSMDMSDEAFIHWHRETEARRLEAEAVPVESSGLRVRGFRFPVTKRNLPDMQASIEGFADKMKRHHGTTETPQLEPCFLVFEETRRLLQFSGVTSGVIGRKIALYMGVSKEDIDYRTNRFLGYIMDGSDTFPSLEAFVETRKPGRTSGADN